MQDSEGGQLDKWNTRKGGLFWGKGKGALSPPGGIRFEAARPRHRGTMATFGATRGRASNSNTSCFRCTVTSVSPAKAVACSASQPVKFHAAKLCR